MPHPGNESEAPKVVGRPIKPGEVRNPNGANQYTYRRNFERSIDRMLSGEITPELLEFIPESVRPLIQTRSDWTTGEVVALCQIVKTLEGDEKAIGESLARMWPRLDRHELTGADGGALEVASESGWARLGSELAVVTRRNESTEGDRGTPGNGTGGRIQ